MARPLVSLLDAFVPALCISCKAAGSLFCVRCRSALKPNVHSVRRHDFSGFSTFELDANLANVILAFKDRGRTAMAPYLARQLVMSVEHIDQDAATLVALPSSHGAIIRRGYDANWLLAKALSKVSGLPVAKSLLSFDRQPADQRSLSAAERVANLKFTMKSPKGQGKLILVDDVVTTGASLLEGRRALIDAGFSVIGFATIAETLLQKPVNIPKVDARAPEWV